MLQPKYYTRLQKFSLLNCHYMFFDTEEYLADALFIRHQVTVNFQCEYAAPDGSYLAVFCSVRKKDEDEFLEALRELPDKMLLFGHADYLQVSTAVFDKLREGRKGREPLSEEGERKLFLHRYPFLRVKDSEASCLDELPEGWRRAFGMEICREIKQALKRTNMFSEYTVLQTKEKFGALCWYDSGAPDEVSEIIEKYTEISKRVCVSCGKPATRITTGWICPFCDECLDTGPEEARRPSMPIEKYYKTETKDEGRKTCEATGASEEAKQESSA